MKIQGNAKEFSVLFSKNRAALAGLAIILLFILIAIIVPLISPFDPFSVSLDSFLPPLSKNHFLGTDNLGRDLYSRFLWGARLSLIVGLFSATLTTFIGLVVGSVAGYKAGNVDRLLMGVTDFFMAIPRFLVVIVIAALFGSTLLNVMIVIGLLFWPGTARIARAEFLSYREREFVQAAKSVGAGDLRIIFSEILPNVLPPIIVSTTLFVPTAILTEAGLSFLGLSDPNLISWGHILQDSIQFLRISWWMGLFPGMGIFLLVLGFNLFGDGLNDVLNPRLRQG